MMRMAGEVVALAADAATLPAMVDRAARTLASAKSAAEVLEARDMASIAYDAAKRAARLAAAKGAFNELLAKITRAQADALDIEARAKRRIADEYDDAQERGEISKQGAHIPEGNMRARDAVPPKSLHEARMIRDAEKASPGIVKATIEEAIEAGEEPTRAKVRRAVLRTVRPEPPPRPRAGRAAIIARVKDAIAALSGLPPPAEVVGFMVGTDEGVIVGENLPAAIRWLAEFADLWPGDQ